MKGFHLRLAIITLVAIGCALAMPIIAHGDETYSILVTPHTELGIQVQRQAQPQAQYVQPAPRAQYVQPRQYSRYEEYMRQRMWFSMNFEKRGWLFPRYVRRSPADTMQRYVYYQMLMGR